MLLEQRVHQGDGEAVSNPAISHRVMTLHDMRMHMRQRISSVVALVSLLSTTVSVAAVAQTPAMNVGNTAAKRPTATHAPVSYTKDVAPILQQRCQV